MISPDEIRQIYDERLAPRLALMERDRRWARLLKIPVLLCGLLFLSGYFYEWTFDWLLSILSILGVIIFGGLYGTIYRRYRKDFKERVVREIVRAINPNYVYAAYSHIGEEQYHASGLLDGDIDRLRGDDLITGRIDRTDFQFSELHSEKLHVSHNSDGKREERWETIFRGIYFLATFNKELGERTVVVPDSANRSIFGHESRRMGSLELVKLENPEFEKIFSVYGTSQQEARYIITPVMMEAMVQIYKQYKRKMYFSFLGANVYCAIPMGKNNFEPKIWRKVKYKDVEEMFSLFSLIEVIIREMNLNTRIWTKE